MSDPGNATTDGERPNPEDRPEPGELELVQRRLHLGLSMVSAALPHLSGLARRVRLVADPRMEVAAVTASGRLLYNPGVFRYLPPDATAFVLAHELLHLALRTHDRTGQYPLDVVNLAHDAVINDILRNETGWSEEPLRGVHREGARFDSLEELCLDIEMDREDGTLDWTRPTGFSGSNRAATDERPLTTMERALRDAGLSEDGHDGGDADDEGDRDGTGQKASSGPGRRRKAPDHLGDVIDRDRERELFPELGVDAQRRAAEAIEREIAQARALRDAITLVDGSTAPGSAPGSESAEVEALHGLFTAPWELVVQRWLDVLGPPMRSWARPSRRAGARSDIVLPGRRRDGWTVHVVLDTSGSMVSVLPAALGALGSLLVAAEVELVHVVQADVGVAGDEWVEPEDLARYTVRGLGGTDLYPALDHVAENPDTEAVLVITDGWFDEQPLEGSPRPWWGLRRLWLVIDHLDFTHHDDPVAHLDGAELAWSS